MKTFALLALTLAVSPAARAHAETETKQLDLKSFSKIVVRNGSGNVAIATVSTGKASVTADKKKFGGSCKLTIELQGKTLLAAVDDSGITGSACNVDFQIGAPRKVDLVVDLGSGELNVKGTSGDVAFKVGSGSVSIDGLVRKLDGKAGSGDVTLRGLTRGGTVVSGSGNLTLVFGAAPAKGDLDLKTGSGNADVEFPTGAKIRTEFRAGSGELTNELGEAPQAGFTVRMTAGSGNLHVRGV